MFFTLVNSVRSVATLLFIKMYSRSHYQINIFNYAQQFWDQYASPKSSHIPFIKGGPWWLLGIVAFYVYFSYFLGPRLMKNRPAMELRKTIIGYNFLMIVLNAYATIEGKKKKL